MRLLIALSLIAFIAPLVLAADSVDISEVQVAGIDFTCHPSKAKEILGEPTVHPTPCADCTDVPMTWFSYDGLKIWHTYDEIFRFLVSSPTYRLKSGVDVGSSRTDVTDAFGEGTVSEADGAERITFPVTWKNGRSTRVVLEFTISDDMVTLVDVTPR